MYANTTMARVEQEGTFIQSEKDIVHIHGVAEQQFALVLLSKRCLKVWYEPRSFEHINGDGRPEGTMPDFFVQNIKSPHKGVFVEITTAVYESQADPKAKQKRVMKSVVPSDRYVVLYRDNLERIQEAYPEIDFFHARRVKR